MEEQGTEPGGGAAQAREDPGVGGRGWAGPRWAAGLKLRVAQQEEDRSSSWSSELWVQTHSDLVKPGLHHQLLGCENGLSTCYKRICSVHSGNKTCTHYSEGETEKCRAKSLHSALNEPPMS